VKRSDLEHLIRAAGAITAQNPLIVVGSQSILATYPDPPASLGVSMEADISPVNEDQNILDLISGSLGEITPFHETFGYYAHGHPPNACPLPADWKTRLIKIENENTNGFSALCLHPLDLAVSKLVAGREKDLTFVATLLAHQMVLISDLDATLAKLPQAEWRSAARQNLTIASRQASALLKDVSG
jgi:hypothetical protein